MDNVAHPLVRVFFALWPSDAERAALAAWQPPLRARCGGRAMRAETLHATLVFLGDVEESRLEALQLAAQEVEGRVFQVAFDVAHYWRHNHILFATASDVPPRLLDLVERLEQSLSRHHFRFDKRSYKLHLTLLRNAQCSNTPKVGNPLPTSGWAELTPPLPIMPRAVWHVRDFALVRSAPDEHGATYQVLARFRLKST